MGQPCQLQVVLNETKEYSNVANLMQLPKGMPAPTTKTAFISWNMEEWDNAVFETLPEWTKEQIKKSTQYQKEHAPVTDVAIGQENTQPAGGVPF